MIWAFEYLREKELYELNKLGSFMDFRFDNVSQTYYWETFCAGFDDNKELRRIRLFSIQQTRQGLICDDWEEARILSGYLSKSALFKDEIENNYKWIQDYLNVRKENHWLNIIAVPVTIFLEYYSENEERLELIDLESLLSRY